MMEFNFLTVGLVGLVTMFAFLTILLLSLNLRSNWHWTVKAGTIVLASYFWVTAYFSIAAFMGLPSTQDLPEEFRLVWSIEVEPTKTEPGEIYIWVSPMNKENNTTPIAYKVPYSKDLHKKLHKAKIGICFGQKFAGKFKRVGGRDGRRWADYWSKPYFEFQQLPPPVLPEKIPQK